MFEGVPKAEAAEAVVAAAVAAVTGVKPDDADEIAKKIRKAKTDPEPLPDTMDGLAERPEARNLVGIYAALDGRTS